MQLENGSPRRQWLIRTALALAFFVVFVPKQSFAQG